jgi:hypothetical protein
MPSFLLVVQVEQRGATAMHELHRAIGKNVESPAAKPVERATMHQWQYFAVLG